MHLSGSARLSFQITTLLYIAAVQTSSHSLTHKVVENLFLSDTERHFWVWRQAGEGEVAHLAPGLLLSAAVVSPASGNCATAALLCHIYSSLHIPTAVHRHHNNGPSLYMTLLQLAHTHTRLIDGSVWRQVVGKEARVGTYSGAAYCDMGPILFLAYFSPAAQKEHDAHVVVML